MVRGDEYQGLLSAGQAIHCILYGGMDGYVTAIQGQQTPGSIKQLGGGAVVMGGSAHISVKFDNGTESVVPESIVRGVQWHIGRTLPLDEIALVDAACASAKAAKAAAAAQADAERLRQLAALPTEYAHLELLKDFQARTGKSYGAGQCAASNARRELKRHFPGTKVSVRYSSFAGGDAVHVDWEDGPTTEEVKKVVDKFADHESDSTGDFMDLAETPFNVLYGGAKFVQTARRSSQQTQSVTEAWAEEQLTRQDADFWGHRDKYQLAWWLVSRHAIPPGAAVVGVERIPGVESGQHPADWYRLIYKKGA